MKRFAARLLQPTLAPGMTLIEMMIVLTIMAAIMAFAAFNVVGMMKAAKIKHAAGESAQIRGFVATFVVEHGRVPSALEEVAVEVDGMPPITEEVPLDPWDNPYVLEVASNGRFTVFSFGPDGLPGTDDDVGPE